MSHVPFIKEIYVLLNKRVWSSFELSVEILKLKA